jgi:hypothetical protein
MFARGDFSSAELVAFQEAIRSWQAVLPASGNGINLQMGGEITGKDCTGCIIVKRKPEMNGTYASLSPIYTSSNFFSKAVINIKANVHKTALLRMVMTHELGHAFGLDDCTECDGNTTVMNSVNRYGFGILSAFARNKMAPAPTRCDIARISDGYTGTARTLAATSAPSAPAVRTQGKVQSGSAAAAAITNAAMRAPALTSARHHVSRGVGPSQRAVRIEQLALMDALAKRD